MADIQLWQVAPQANDVKNDDGVIIGGQTAGTRYAPLTLIASYVHNLWAAFINAITPLKTSFASGDKIPVVNGSTATAMEADKLLELTAQNALGAKVAPTFSDETTYTKNKIVSYLDKIERFVKSHIGAYSSGDVKETTIANELEKTQEALGRAVLTSNANISASIAADVGMTYDNYTLNGNGYLLPDNTCKVKRYNVTAGTTIYVKSKVSVGANYQFSSSSTPYPDYLIGEAVYMDTDSAVVVPTGAGYIFVAMDTTEDANCGVFYYDLPVNTREAFGKVYDYEDVTFTTSEGYLDSYGNVVAAGVVTKERVTNFIDLVFKAVKFSYKLNTGSAWFSYCWYDEDKKIIGTRLNVSTFGNLFPGYYTAEEIITPPPRAKYIRLSFRTYDDYSFSLQSCNDINYLPEAKGEIEKLNVETDTSFVMNLFKDSPFYGHLFIDTIESAIGWPFPCMSILDVNASHRLGLKVIEGSLHPTATAGKYIVMHGVGADGKIGNQLYDPNGTDITDVVINETSFDTLRSYRYRNPYPNGRTQVSSLEEFLMEVKKNKMIPLIFYVDDVVLDIAMSIFGNGFILYTNDTTRPSKFKGPMIVYTRILSGAFCEQTIREMKNPLILLPNNGNYLTDSQIAECINATHKNNALFGFVGCYSDEPTIQKYLSFGCDVIASGWNVPFDESGNIDNISCDVSFSELTTDGTIEDNSIVLTNGQSVSFTSDSSVFLGKELLAVRFSGELIVNLDTHIQNQHITSDGVSEIKMSTYIASYVSQTNIPAFRLEAVGNVTIYGLQFKSSKV